MCKAKCNTKSDRNDGKNIRTIDIHSDSEFLQAEYGFKKKTTKKQCWCRCFTITAIVLFVILLVLFVIVFVILPLVFMLSIGIQRYLIFTNYDDPANPEFNNFPKYDVEGVRNIYPTVNENEGVVLGTWHLVPESLIEKSRDNNTFSYDIELRNAKQVLLYFHGNGGNRIAPLEMYRVLRKHFHVIAFDYREYGDSTPALLTEENVVNDSIEMYKWLQKKTRGKIFVWGHSLGTALSTHTLARLKDENIVPTGLALEAPFTTMREEVNHHPIGKIFSWLPWFAATILDPLEENGFLFKTSTNILKVDCPIMIVHAEDDPIIPYTLGKKLSEIARNERNLSRQGEVVYHQMPSVQRLSHLEIHKSPNLPGYVEKFIELCLNFDIIQAKRA